MPIGATLGTAEVWQVFQEQPLIHTSTFGGNELACAAANAAIEVLIEEQLAQRSESMGQYFKSGIQKLAAQFPEMFNEVRGIGLMIGLEMASDDISELFIANLIEQKVLVAFALNQPGVIRIEPPLLIDTTLIDEVLQRMAASLDATRQIIKQFST